MFVALVIEMQCAGAVFYCHLWPVWLYIFPHCRTKDTDTQTHTAGKWGFGTASLSFILFCVMYPNWQLPATLRRSDHLWGPPSLVCKTCWGGALFPETKRSKRKADHSTAPTADDPLPSIGRALHRHLRPHIQLFKLLYQSHTLTATLKPYLTLNGASRSPMWPASTQLLVSRWYILCSGRKWRNNNVSRYYHSKRFKL